MEYRCKHCSDQAALEEGKTLLLKNRWGVRGMRIVAGKSDGTLRDLSHSDVLHERVEVIGVSIPDQDSELLNAQAADFASEYMEEGIYKCRVSLRKGNK